MARRGFGAVDAVAPLDDVEVYLEDPLFRQRSFQEICVNRLAALTKEIAVFRQEKVLGQLLRHGRGTSPKTRQRRDPVVLGRHAVFLWNIGGLRLGRTFLAG